MNLFETAFAYVQRAFRGAGPQVVEGEPPAPFPGASDASTPGDAAQESGSVALLMSAEPLVLVMDGAEEPEAEPAEEDEFADLLSGIGAVNTPRAEASAFELKDREIAELQRNLEMLRPIGEELARVEQLRLAEQASFETQLAELRAELQDQRQAEPAATAASQAQGPGLHDISRLIAALDSTLSEAGCSQAEAPAASAAKAETRDDTRLARTREQLASARRRLAEQKQKTARRREEAKGLRVRVKALEQERRALVAQRKRLLAPVRELARRAKRRTRPLTRLMELLDLELD